MLKVDITQQQELVAWTAHTKKNFNTHTYTFLLVSLSPPKRPTNSD